MIDGGLLLMALLFGIIGVRTLSARSKANSDMMSKYMAIDWQDMKAPMPPANYGMSFIYLIISFSSALAFIIAVCVSG